MTSIKDKGYMKDVFIETEEGKRRKIRVNKCWVSPMVTCMCSKCAGPYFSRGDRKIIRLNPDQYVFEKCDICNYHKGYDFVVFANKVSSTIGA